MRTISAVISGDCFLLLTLKSKKMNKPSVEPIEVVYNEDGTVAYNVMCVI